MPLRFWLPCSPKRDMSELPAALNLRVIPWDHELAEAAYLSSLAWTHGISLRDRACPATARKLGVTAVTADRDWATLPALGIRIDVIR